MAELALFAEEKNQELFGHSALTLDVKGVRFQKYLVDTNKNWIVVEGGRRAAI